MICINGIARFNPNRQGYLEHASKIGALCYKLELNSLSFPTLISKVQSHLAFGGFSGFYKIPFLTCAVIESCITFKQKEKITFTTSSWDYIKVYALVCWVRILFLCNYLCWERKGGSYALAVVYFFFFLSFFLFFFFYRYVAHAYNIFLYPHSFGPIDCRFLCQVPKQVSQS